MVAYLTSIVFDQSTADYLCGEIVAAGQEGTGFMLMDSCADLGTRFKLKNMRGCNYKLIISADIEKNPTITLTLAKVGTDEVVKSIPVDISPIMESSVLYSEDYAEAASKFENAMTNRKLEKDWADSVFKICAARSEYLHKILAPDIPAEKDFYIELLAALDFLTGYYVASQTLDATPDRKKSSWDKDLPNKPVFH